MDSNENQTAFIKFETTTVLIAKGLGNGTEGSALISFITPDGSQIYTTLLNQVACEYLAAEMATVVKSVPKLLSIFRDVPGAPETPKNSIRFFEQEYDAEVLQSLGVLMVRANLLESSLLRLFASITDMSLAQSEDILLSTIMFSSKISMVRAAVTNSGIDEERKKLHQKALDRVDRVTKRRNHLVHANWSFDGPQLKAATRKETHVVTAEMLQTLAADYRSAGVLLEACALDYTNNRQVARRKQKTNAAGSPDYSWRQ